MFAFLCIVYAAADEATTLNLKNPSIDHGVEPASTNKHLDCSKTVDCHKSEYHWDHQLCRCIRPLCVDTVDCIIGDHWDPEACKCTKDCPVSSNEHKCKAKHHWNPVTCECIENCDTLDVICLNGRKWNVQLCECD